MKSTSSALAAAAAISFGVAGCATQESHEGHARLGTVNFPVECNAAAQREFNVAMAYYHSFAWQHIREPLERRAQGRSDLRHGALGAGAGEPRQPLHLARHHLRRDADPGPRHPRDGAQDRAQVAARARLRRRSGGLLQRPRQARSPHARQGARKRAGAGDEALPAGHGSRDSLRAGPVGQLRSDGPQVHQPAQGRGGPRADLQAAAGASRRRALPHPQLRLPADRQAGPGRGEALRQDRAGRAARAAHAVAHLHARGGVEGVDRSPTGRRRAPGPTRPSTSGTRTTTWCTPTCSSARTRAARKVVDGGAQQSGARRSLRHGLRLCRHAGTPGARARGLEGGGEAGARSRRGASPGRSTRRPRRSMPTRAASAPR